MFVGMTNNLSEPEDKIKVIDYVPDGYREFKSIIGKTYLAPKKSCLFCKHCTDVYLDYTHGPYMLICENGHNAWEHFENCTSFEEG